MDRDEGRTELHSHSMVRSTTTADDCALDGSSLATSSLGVSNGTRMRKRKSRWDQEAKTNDDDCQDRDVPPPVYDFPPGFSSPINDLKEQCTSKQPIMGHCQHRFNSNLPVSFGIPLNAVQKFGIPLIGSSEGWAVAPGTPFHPFPPLPTYPCGRKVSVSPAASSKVPHQPAETPSSDCCDKINNLQPQCYTQKLTQPSENCLQDFLCQTMQNPTARRSGANPPPEFATGEHSHQRPNDSFNLGRRYFRQQKWSGSKLVPPWLRMRNSWGYTGNNAKNGMCRVGHGNVSTEFSLHGPETVDLMKEVPGHTLPKN